MRTVKDMHVSIEGHRRRTESLHRRLNLARSRLIKLESTAVPALRGLETTLHVTEALQRDWKQPSVDEEFEECRGAMQDIEAERWYFVTDFGFRTDGGLSWCTPTCVPSFAPGGKSRQAKAGIGIGHRFHEVCMTTCPKKGLSCPDGWLACRVRRWRRMHGGRKAHYGRSIAMWEICFRCAVQGPHHDWEIEDARDEPVAGLYRRPS